MKVLVTGATGFVGRHVVQVLKALEGCDVIASGRCLETLRSLDCDFVEYDLTAEHPDCFRLLGEPDALIHLAWDAISDYRDLRHTEHILWSHYRFLRSMLAGGLKSLACAGTCFEYGLQQGCLSEDLPSQPQTSYAVAKDALRRFLEVLRQNYSFGFRWLRIFFTFGEGQHPRALISQLDRAIDEGADSFPMSGGEQLRDYLPVNEVAERVVQAGLQDKINGVINICSGKPISVRSLVEQRMRERGRMLHLELGHFPYPVHEPMAYWGDDRLLDQAMRAYADGHVPTA